MRSVIHCTRIEHSAYRWLLGEIDKPLEDATPNPEYKLYAQLSSDNTYASLGEILYRAYDYPFMPHCIWLPHGSLSIKEARNETHFNRGYHARLLKEHEEKNLTRLYVQLKQAKREHYRMHSVMEFVQDEGGGGWSLNYLNIPAEHLWFYKLDGFEPEFNLRHNRWLGGVRDPS